MWEGSGSPDPDVEALARLLFGALRTGRVEGQPPPERVPSLARYYETTVCDVPGTGLDLRIVSVPQPPRLAAHWTLHDDPPPMRDIANDLAIVDYRDVVPADLPLAMYGTLAAPLARGTEGDPVQWAREASWHADAELNFYSRAALEALVPVEASSPRGASLAVLATTGSANLGVGYEIANGHPLVLLYVPLGLILVGAATGVAKALEEGLHARLMHWITGEELPREEDPS
jgi:hypothetical protein